MDSISLGARQGHPLDLCGLAPAEAAKRASASCAQPAEVLDRRTIPLPYMGGPGWLGFELELASLSAAFEADRIAYRVELDRDTLAPSDPPDHDGRDDNDDDDNGDDDDQQRLFERRRGGKVDRPPPTVEELLACCPRGTAGRRDDVEGCPDASDRECAERIQWVYEHRGRGLSAADYDWQREWTVARALGFGFFAGRREAGKPPPDLPETLAKLGGRGPAAFRRRKLLGMLTTADRMQKTGLTISGPELASLLGCATSTAWADLEWAERKGFVVRMRRYKPGRDGAPVALAANWYGVGAALRRHRAAYWGEQQAVLHFGAGEVQGAKAVGFAELRGRLRRHRTRHRRSRHETLCRYEGRPLPRRPGRRYVSRREWIRELLDGANEREHERFLLRMAREPHELECAALGLELAQGELPGDWLERLGAASEVASASVAVVHARSVRPSALLEVEPGYVVVAAELLERSQNGATVRALEGWLDEQPELDDDVEDFCGWSLPAEEISATPRDTITIRKTDGIPGSTGKTWKTSTTALAETRLQDPETTQTPPEIPPPPTHPEPRTNGFDGTTTNAVARSSVRSAAQAELARAIEDLASPELRSLLHSLIGPAPPPK